MATKTASLYVNDNGEISCVDHAGAYLASEYQYSRERNEYWTPLGSWERVDDDFAAEWLAIVGKAPQCATCSR